jgi:hypothetical protein
MRGSSARATTAAVVVVAATVEGVRVDSAPLAVSGSVAVFDDPQLASVKSVARRTSRRTMWRP